ncbi:MAG: DUF523 domain-containing protein [Bacillota bacterium]
MILVSCCLLDLHAKYDGGTNANTLLMDYTRLGKYIPVCPEQLGGLPTPRSPVEITGGSGEDVIWGNKKACGEDGRDVTAEFIKGAGEILKIARAFPVTAAILKERSPSCGSSLIYDGTFQHITKPGQGVTTALLRKHNIPVYSEEEITKELLEKLLAD